MSSSNVKRPTLRRRPVNGTAAQVEPALKAAAGSIAANRAEQPSPTKRFIFKGEVLERVGGVSGVCLWRWMRDGKFPVARSVGGRNAWLESDIDEWMLSRPLRQYNRARTRD
jgi:predicted DNA-binding transcriptional regulator AlpA